MMILNPYLPNDLNPIYNGITGAWPLSEDGSQYMLRDATGSGNDFFGDGITSVGGFAQFAGSSNSYAAADGAPLALGSDTSFTLCVTLKPANTSAGTRLIITKGITSLSASQCEWNLYQSGSNLIFRLYNGALTAERTSTLTAGVEATFIIGYDSVNQNLTMKKNTGALSTLSWTSGTVYNIGSIKLGVAQAYTTLNYTGGIKNLMFWNGRYLDATEQATLIGLGMPYGVLPNQSRSLNPDDLNNQVLRFDFSDVSTMYQDTAKTTPVASNDDPIRVIESTWGTIEAEAPSDGERPLFKAASQNGIGTAYTNGVDTRLNISQRIQSSRLPFTLMVIAKSDNPATYGSHWMSNQGNYATYSASYLTQTSPTYSSNYFACHLSETAGGAVPNTQAPVTNPSGYNAIEFFGSDTIVNLLDSGSAPVNTGVYWNKTNINPLDFDTLFKDIYGGNWWALGNCAEIIALNIQLTVAQRARVRKYFADKWGLVNIKYFGY